MSKITITIMLDNEKLTRTVMRCFDQGVVVLGEDYDDHDVWLVDGQKIELIGTLVKSVFDCVCKLGLSESVKLCPHDFQFLQAHFNDFKVETKRIYLPAIKDKVYSYHEVCSCGQHVDRPVGPCDCWPPKVLLPIPVLLRD